MRGLKKKLIAAIASVAVLQERLPLLQRVHMHLMMVMNPFFKEG